MKVVIRGNYGKRLSWYKEHEFQIWCSLCGILGMAILVIAWIIK